MSLLLIAALTAGNMCPAVKLLVVSKQEWKEEDNKAIPEAVKGCEKHYSIEHCLKSLTKTGHKQYKAICIHRKYL